MYECTFRATHNTGIPSEIGEKQLKFTSDLSSIRFKVIHKQIGERSTFLKKFAAMDEHEDFGQQRLGYC